VYNSEFHFHARKDGVRVHHALSVVMVCGTFNNVQALPLPVHIKRMPSSFYSMSNLTNFNLLRIFLSKYSKSFISVMSI
jgi:hypothetical protein